MPYRFATTRSDSSDLASDFVMRSAPGYPAFPVRLAIEVFSRAASHLPAGEPITLWDPCCGSGYLATVLGLLGNDRLHHIIASDVDPDAVNLASRNLALLTPGGLAERERQLRHDAQRLGKPGYIAAADATRRLAALLERPDCRPVGHALHADVFSPSSHALAARFTPNLVITDIPYGHQAHWRGQTPARPLSVLLRTLGSALPSYAVIAIAARARTLSTGGARTLERFKIGARSVVLLNAETARNAN